ncbi:Cell surface mannoprotein mp65 [Pleosporales sp. CAS-2024a]
MIKSSVTLAALVAAVFVGSAAGRPFVDKRAIVTDVVYVTETVANVVVYVDESGIPYSTGTGMLSTSASTIAVSTPFTASPTCSELAPAPQAPSSSAALVSPATSSSAPAAPSTSSTSSALGTPTPSAEPSTAKAADSPAPATSVAPQPTTTRAPATSTYQAPPPPPPPPASSTAVPANKPGDSGSLGLGVTWDVYTGTAPNTQCKSPDLMNQEWAQMKDFNVVRLYAADCNSIPIAVQNALKYGQKLMAGVYLPTGDLDQTIQAYKNAIDQYNHGDWSVIALFSVENEAVSDHRMTASGVVDAINNARGKLRGLGYSGPVGAVETVPAMSDNPAICAASDVIMINCHAFFDANTQAQNAGTFVKSQVEALKQVCPGKRVVVTESGWPHQGNSNGQAAPSLDNQKAAIASIQANFDHDMFLFNAFDSLWKTNGANTFNAEQFWGIMH